MLYKVKYSNLNKGVTENFDWKFSVDILGIMNLHVNENAANTLYIIVISINAILIEQKLKVRYNTNHRANTQTYSYSI